MLRGGNDEEIIRVNWDKDNQRNHTYISNRGFYWLRKWAKTIYCFSFGW